MIYILRDYFGWLKLRLKIHIRETEDGTERKLGGYRNYPRDGYTVGLTRVVAVKRVGNGQILTD